MIKVDNKNVKVIKFNNNDVKKVIQNGDYIWAKPVGRLLVEGNLSDIPTPRNTITRIVTYEPTASAKADGTIYYDDSFRVDGGPCDQSRDPGFYVFPSLASSGTTTVTHCTGQTRINAYKYYFSPSISHSTSSGTDLDRNGKTVSVTNHTITIHPLPNDFDYCNFRSYSVVEITSLSYPTMSAELDSGNDSWTYTIKNSSGKIDSRGGITKGSKLTTEELTDRLNNSTITLSISIPSGSTGTGSISLKAYPGFSSAASQGCVSYSIEYFNNSTVSSTTT